MPSAAPHSSVILSSPPYSFCMPAKLVLVLASTVILGAESHGTQTIFDCLTSLGAFTSQWLSVLLVVSVLTPSVNVGKFAPVLD
jgi:hypothetical protein